MEDRIFITCDYCDDIRQEIGNKLTLVGLYGPDLQVSQAPVILPKLCVYVRIWIPVHCANSGGVLRIKRGDAVLAEMNLPAPPAELQSGPPSPRWRVHAAGLTLAPFPIESDGFLTCTYEGDGEILDGPKLRIRVAALESATPA